MKKHFPNLAVPLLPALIIGAGSLYLFLSFHANDTSKQVPIDIPKEAENKSDGALKSFFDNESDYDKAFQNLSDAKKVRILAGITPHHFLAKDMIARFYSGIDNDSPETIILVGPDHFGQMKNADQLAATTSLDWDTPFGKMPSDKSLLEKLTAIPVIGINDEIFKNEHSIYTEVPFLKKVFPDSKILPLVIRSNASYEQLGRLGEKLKAVSGKNDILVISSDFSHNASIAQAETSDRNSVSNLSSLNDGNIEKINCDCRACLALALGYLPQKTSFRLLENKNSSDFGSPDPLVTSYITGYFISDENEH